MKDFWQTSNRKISYQFKTLVMGILNITPDSFSDGGNYLSLDKAVSQAEQMIQNGADIIDVGGESTRPNSKQVETAEEIRRVVPVIEEIARRFDFPISIDTCKSEVALRALEAGAEIVNDISGMKFDENIGEVAAKSKAGIVLMHLRGSFENMHSQNIDDDIICEVISSLRKDIRKAFSFGIKKENIALDIGFGFSKSFEQNLELIAKTNRICEEFSDFPILTGTSRKSFIGKILGNLPTENRLHGSIASALVCVVNGAKIVRVHDVKETVEALKVVDEIKKKI
jgi:dihydropteroate synthase